MKTKMTRKQLAYRVSFFVGLEMGLLVGLYGLPIEHAVGFAVKSNANTNAAPARAIWYYRVYQCTLGATWGTR